MNAHVFKSLLAKLALSTVVACSAGVGAASAAEPVKIAVTNWADVLAVANVAKYVLETQLKQPVQFVQADIGIQYQGVARGDLDIMVGGWLPVTHGAYYAKYKNDLDDVGIIYTGGKNGWAVPTRGVAHLQALHRRDARAARGLRRDIHGPGHRLAVGRAHRVRRRGDGVGLASGEERAAGNDGRAEQRSGWANHRVFLWKRWRAD